MINKGFTLIELLVAIFIVAVIGTIALSGLSRTLDLQIISQDRLDRWREVQLAVRIISQDLAQIHPRPTREELGEAWQPSIIVDPNSQFDLEFSRGGWNNLSGLPRGSVLRVSYDQEDDLLIRFTWNVMDRTLSTPPTRTELLSGVIDMSIRMLDKNGEWYLEWPPPYTENPNRLEIRPKLIEIRIILDDMGEIWRTIEIGA
ncbi:MAG: type II secretion system minor pseudopilin GspJ [Pseudomonadota bacterium]|nr:type II secretion system minor pseudopilin GspJ [Pseudomonadota bacterium]|tara:strand:- start:3104 stop:3709 length:606 start_codon:yes stop_codon:yes gene_type:complete